ncbi:hypothetical protein [Arthrobacter alpinus]|uniref:hypothetical protein n=1 Tax=Arthrobacter alpinus TaxID=656366 RepID=UPI0012FF2C9A|nr:hypothetical protein [Arthrobacter alpinus]
MIESLATDSLAASSSTSFSIQPYFVFVIIAVVLISSFVKASARKRRANRENPNMPFNQAQVKPSGRAGVAHQAGNVPYVGTLLNGVPINNYDSSHGHQTTGFANERMRAEAELKRQLDALDTARRNGQVTAEQYAVHREAIFKAF